MLGQKVKGQGHRVIMCKDIIISVEGDQVAGISLHSIAWLWSSLHLVPRVTSVGWCLVVLFCFLTDFFMNLLYTYFINK